MDFIQIITTRPKKAKHFVQIRGEQRSAAQWGWGWCTSSASGFSDPNVTELHASTDENEVGVHLNERRLLLFVS